MISGYLRLDGVQQQSCCTSRTCDEHDRYGSDAALLWGAVVQPLLRCTFMECGSEAVAGHCGVRRIYFIPPVGALIQNLCKIIANVVC